MHLPTVYKHPTTLDQTAPLSSTIPKRPMLNMAPKPHLGGHSLTSGLLTDGPHMHGFRTSSQPAFCAQAVSNSSLLIPAQTGDCSLPYLLWWCFQLPANKRPRPLLSFFFQPCREQGCVSTRTLQEFRKTQEVRRTHGWLLNMRTLQGLAEARH